MLSDWQDHFFIDNEFISDAVEYYLSAIMIYENNGEYEIIDGQQRLTTLLIMDYVWNRNTSAVQESRLEFNYNSQISFKKIKENKNFLSSKRSTLVASKFHDIISKLVVSVIVTNSEDRVFVL